MKPIRFHAPVLVESWANFRGALMKRARLTKKIRSASEAYARSALIEFGAIPIKERHRLRVSMQRCMVGRDKPYDEPDNLAMSMKPVRDGIADAVGIDDGNSRFEWSCSQKRNGRPPGVLVEIEVVDREDFR